MKNTLLILLIILFFTPFTFSQKDSVIIGPGVTYYEEYRSAGPWQFDVVVIDLTNPWLKLKTVKAQDRLKAFERTSSMASRNHREGHQVVAAINGDFYNTGTGESISTQVADGQLLQNANNRLNFAWNSAKKSMMAVTASSGNVVKGSSSALVTGFNASRVDNSMILYNSFFGSTTSTNSYGTEVLVNPVNDWVINDTVFCVVQSKATTGNMSIPVGKAVLSGHGTSAAFLNDNINVGDTIKLYVQLNPGLPGLNQLIGGNPILVQNGVVVGPSDDRHPRTAIGINQDSTKLIFITVDGRQPGYSVGMNLFELGSYMKEWGVYQGLNLDGGGSTTMVIRGKVVNSPSDGTERTVSNGLLLVSTAPTDTLNHIRISPKLSYAATGTTVQYSVKGFDQYYNPVTVPTASIQWGCDPSIGTISGTGLYTAASEVNSGYVVVTSGALKDSALVHITTPSSVTIQPSPVILQIGQAQQMTAVARDNFDNIITLPASAFEWSVEGGVGIINSTGFFTATTHGSGSIKAKYQNITGSVPVEVGASIFVMIDDFTTISGYTITTLLASGNISLDNSIYFSSPSSCKLTYSLTGSGTSAIYITKDIPISGTPDKIGIWVYGDGKGHWLRGEFKDADGERFLIDLTDASPGIDWTDEWRYIEREFSKAIPSWANPNAVLTYPVTWMRTYLVETKNDNKNSGVIYFDDFRVHFIGEVPVELNSFTAAVNGSDVVLNWSTSTETNNHGFEIQRTTDNKSWITAGFVKGNGTTTESNSYTFSEKCINQGKLYYRLKQVDLDGSFAYSEVLEVEIQPTAFELHQNYPNPFNPATVIKFSLPDVTEIVTIKVYDIIGNEIATLLNEQKPAGNYEVIFNAEKIPAGVYFYRLNAGSYNQTRKMILIK
jgi:exopolysaccharide biosynthesis protein